VRNEVIGLLLNAGSTPVKRLSPAAMRVRYLIVQTWPSQALRLMAVQRVRVQ
jgi:hypothetical protein